VKKIDGQNAHPLADVIGIMPDEDAEEMLRIVEEEFEEVDAGEWSRTYFEE
jgi:hypothetical protein